MPAEGVLIHGLFIEGAAWSKTERRLDEAEPKKLAPSFPILHVFARTTALP